MSLAHEDGLLKLTVADNGRGVSAEKAKRLMQPFVQADIKNRSEGSGLGLAICKRLVELANGKISIETAPGKGFKISAVAKIAVADETKAKSGKGASASAVKASDLPKRVLVVDDSPVNRMVFKAMLEKLGVTNVELVRDLLPMFYPMLADKQQTIATDIPEMPRLMLSRRTSRRARLTRNRALTHCS